MSETFLKKGGNMLLFPKGFVYPQQVSVNVNTILPLSLLLIFILVSAADLRAQQLHTHSNAASMDDEADSFSGWGGSALRSSVSTEAYSGSYSIKIESPNDGWNYSAYSFATTPNEQYTITFYAKSASTTNPRLYWGGGGVVENQAISITSSSWAQYSKTVTAQGSTINLNVYPGSPALAGESVFIDYFSILPANGSDTQAPTAPTLSSGGKTDTTVDLTWDGASDNVGITGYKIFKDSALEATLGNVNTYQVTGLTASTTYSFTIKALDTANNESVSSNSVAVTTSSGSGGNGSSIWSESGSTASYSGEVAIGTGAVPSGYKLGVEGKIRAREIRVDQDTWPDYVFNDDYQLATLEEIQKHIEERGHLPNIPSATEVKANGIELGEMDRLLLEKIEELTLHAIKQQQLLEQQQQQIDMLQKQIALSKNN